MPQSCVINQKHYDYYGIVNTISHSFTVPTFISFSDLEKVKDESLRITRIRKKKHYWTHRAFLEISSTTNILCNSMKNDSILHYVRTDLIGNTSFLLI